MKVLNKRIVSLLNEGFELSIKNSRYILQHPKWPALVGVGNSLKEAERDLYNEINIIAEAYVYESDSNLSEEAQYLKRFLLNVVPIKFKRSYEFRMDG